MLRKFSALWLVLLASVALAQTNYTRMLSGVNYQAGSSYSLQPIDTTRLTAFSSSGATAVCLSSPGALCSGVAAGSGALYGAGAIFSLANTGTGTVTVTCQSCTINGASTLQLNPTQGADLYGDGTNYAAQLGSGLSALSTTQIGDCLRFNVNGNGVYNGVNCATNFESVFSMQGTGTPNALGAFGNNGLTTAGSAVNFPATATQGGGITYSSAATGSLNTLIGVRVGNNGNNSVGPFLAIYRYSLKLQLNVLSSVRYWIGLGCWNAVSGLGNNSVQILATTAYATDTPNKSTIGFRFSAGTDTHWQAVTAVAGGSQTTVDTGITPDTNVHLFEFAPNSTGTAIVYLIDGAVVATISTNLPPMGLASDSMATMFWSGDNKNTNTSVSANFFWMQETMK